MKIFVFLLLASLSAWSEDRLKLSFPSSEVKQGALLRARLVVLPGQINLPLQKLKGTSFGETLYFHRIDPLLRENGSEIYESEVQVIFIKVPQGNSVSGTAGSQPIVLEWDRLTVHPVEASDKMLWADFSAPEFIEHNLVWIWGFVIVIPLLIAGVFFSKKIRRKQRIKARKRELQAEFRNCQSYDQVVSLWQKKRTYISEFPFLEEHFKELELVLFKYQFKPMQTEHEKAEVMAAYKHLLEKSEGGMRGI